MTFFRNRIAGHAVTQVPLHTASGQYMLDLAVADNFLARFRGLMLAPPLRAHQGLLLTRCASVHCAFMRAPIDVVYLDASGTVTKCVAGLGPWRASAGRAGREPGGARYRRPAHTLELAAGTIARLGIAAGATLAYPGWGERALPTSVPPRHAQRGSAMIEFTIVGPLITLLGLSVLQYGMLFAAKNQMNHASFMAARAGAMGNASMDAIRNAYARALVPMYGGGQTPDELAASLAKATADLGAGNFNIEIINPTVQSFSDFNDPALQAALKTGGRRVIPNSALAFKDPAVGATSGQTIQDANLIKLRITHGYVPKIPFVDVIYRKWAKWLDTGDDAFHSKMVDAGRIPVVTNVTVQMQSDAIEESPISSPGAGNGGNPTNPGDPPSTDLPPPSCGSVGCTTPPGPVTPPPPVCDPLRDPNRCEPGQCPPGTCCVPAK